MWIALTIVGALIFVSVLAIGIASMRTKSTITVPKMEKLTAKDKEKLLALYKRSQRRRRTASKNTEKGT